LILSESDRKVWAADDGESNAKYIAIFYVGNDQTIDESRAEYNSKLVTYKPGEQSVDLKVNINNSKKLYLVVSNGGDDNNWDHADWIDPTISGPKGSLKLTELTWVKAIAGWGNVQVNKSIAGNNLKIGNTVYSNGIGTHAGSIIEYDLPEGYNVFTAKVGLDRECTDHTEGATVRFHVFTQYPSLSGPQDSIDILVPFEKIGIKGNHTAYDVWTKQNLGEFNENIKLNVKNHGVRLIKLN
jgi:hypothetical protein